tara:strand:- start:281 stop:670 length:390 start_codon:yes stop_codon:yes gene_type:complete
MTIKVNENTPWVVDLLNEDRTINLNGRDVPIAIYNFTICKGQLRMWTKHQMKATRGWKVTDVKKYFGIKGSGEELMNSFLDLYNHVMVATGLQDPEENCINPFGPIHVFDNNGKLQFFYGQEPSKRFIK